ncbi:hypothetical protein FSP39_017192 [Pinctada imbricata]|uniref:C1q domain-containing protein n=1 Tax=Pinctada imbricata TaxID=66713 RepID=A0AA89BKP8_PINIB|nr:hypothetical protein FSP39_017192 [Pinctada imbricata]
MWNLLHFAVALMVGINFAATAEQDVSRMLVQTVQAQLQTCMEQNADLVKRSCSNRNSSSFGLPILPKVAFHAGLNKDVENLPYNSKLVFDKVYLNQGLAYDPITGVFTCPTHGIYVFHWTITTKAGKYFYTDFMVNGQMVGRSHPNANTVNRASSSSVVQRLKKEDKVWIEPLDSYSGQYAYAGWSFYSGYML